MDNQTRITGSRYVLAVKDLARSVTYYKTQLGFETWWEGDGWHFIKRDQFLIMLGECPDDVSAHETHNHSYFAYLEVENIRALYDEYKGKAVEILSAPTDQPWGQREFGIRTPDGHRIMFGESINL